ncbi:MAG: radical SAM protein [Pseudomonadota bacterium]
MRSGCQRGAAPPFHLKPQKGRLLVPVGARCPFGCEYCYTEFDGFRTHTWSVHELLAEIHRLQPRYKIRTFQVGYDGDPLASWDRARPLLEALAPLGANLNIQTKSVPDEGQLAFLADLARSLRADDRIFSALVTLTSWDTAPRLEPGAPAPADRVGAMVRLQSVGIPVLVALRPMIPGIPRREIVRVLEATRDAGVRGVIPGPLYIHATWPGSARFLQGFEEEPIWQRLQTVPVAPPWDPQGSRWLRISSRRAMRFVKDTADRLGLPIFWSSAAAMDALELPRGGVAP